MKKLLMIVMCTMFTSSLWGSFEQYTIDIASATVTTIVWEYNPRTVYINNPDVDVYTRYRIDGSTVNIATGGDSGNGDGYYLPTWQGQSLATRDNIYLQLEPGEATINVNVLIDRE